MTPPLPPKFPPKRRVGLCRRLHDRHWKKLRGNGPRPIFRDLFDWLVAPRFGRWLKRIAVFALVAPFALLLVPKFKAVALLSIFGLALDIVGVLYLFREWVLQYIEGEARAYGNIDRQVGSSTDDESMNLTEDDPPAVTVARHLADGLRDRLNEHVVPALAGIACLCTGFAFQLAASLIGALFS